MGCASISPVRSLTTKVLPSRMLTVWGGGTFAAAGAPTEVLAGLLPRIRDDALHAAVAALHDSLLV